jgi:hypothetical protein
MQSRGAYHVMHPTIPIQILRFARSICDTIAATYVPSVVHMGSRYTSQNSKYDQLIRCEPALSQLFLEYLPVGWEVFEAS